MSGTIGGRLGPSLFSTRILAHRPMRPMEANVAMETGPVCELVAVEKTYVKGRTTVRALDGVSLRLNPGDFVAVVGPSGSGKTTLLNVIGALDRPTRGQVRIAGQDILLLDDYQVSALRNRHIGFVFQSYNLIPELTALENVALPLFYAGMSRKARHQRAQLLLESVALGPRANHRPSELSGGEEQRVAVARALANNPTIVLADEPTGNVDTQSRDAIMALLGHLNDKGTTIVVVTHDRVVASHARRLLQMENGRLSG